MKTFIPKNIQGWFFNISLQVGPLTITLIQLFLLAWGIAVWLGIFNTLSQSGVDRMIAIIMSLPAVAIFVFIAFFKYSELTLVPFIFKIIRSNFIDTPKKFQVNYKRVDPLDIVLKNIHNEDGKKQIIEQKSSQISEEKLEKLEKESII